MATFLIAILLVPALQSMSSAIQGTSLHTSTAIGHYSLTSKMENILAKSFEELDLEAEAAGGPGTIVTAYSDEAGTEGRRLVYLARYDGDNADGDNDPFTGADQGLLWVQVRLEDSLDVVQTLTGQ